MAAKKTKTSIHQKLRAARARQGTTALERDRYRNDYIAIAARVEALRAGLTDIAVGGEVLLSAQDTSTLQYRSHALSDDYMVSIGKQLATKAVKLKDLVVKISNALGNPISNSPTMAVMESALEIAEHMRKAHFDHTNRIAALRLALRQVLVAIDNGSAAGEGVSDDFLCGVPDEVEAYRKRVFKDSKERLDDAQREITDLKAKIDALEKTASVGVEAVKWEYLVLVLPDSTAENASLDECGADGWELTSTVHSGSTYHYLKRRL